jgi:hypothetical protein
MAQSDGTRMKPKKRKQGSLGKGFAPLYENVLKSEPVRTLPLVTYKLFNTLTGLCKPWNNGAVPLCRSVLRDFGILSGDTTSRSITLLIERGLIVRTRKARPRHAALYGVCHLPLNAEAMKKTGARTPSTPSVQRTENSVRPTDRESVAPRTELDVNYSDSVRPTDRVGPVLTSNSVRPTDPSKNLPCREAGSVPLPPVLAVLLQRVYELGGTVTAGKDLRVRWWHGDPPADLAGELKIHAAELYRHLAARPDGTIPTAMPRERNLRS